MLVACLTGCGEGALGEEPTVVFAASSLTEAFELAAREYEAREREGGRPGGSVTLSFAGSQVLRLQIQQGAPADVFVSADPDHVATLEREGLVEPGVVVAHNRLVVVVPEDNPAGLASFEDLPRAPRVVLAGPTVPAGRYARRLLAAAAARYGAPFERDVLAHVVSEESNVRLACTRVELGEADAAIVYASDAAASPGLRVLPVPPALNVRADYVAALVRRSARRERAEAWIAFLRSPAGAGALIEAGLEPAGLLEAAPLPPGAAPHQPAP